MADSTSTPISLGLITLPAEIQAIIYGHTTASSGSSICPVQSSPGSSKVICHMDLNTEQTAAAMNLRLVCRTTDHVMTRFTPFYERNHFEFRGSRDLLVYLAILPPLQRNALRRMASTWDFGKVSAAFKLLSLCHGLEELTVDITLMSCYFETGIRRLSDAKGYQELVSLRGLKSFSLTYTTAATSSDPKKDFMLHTLTRVLGTDDTRINRLKLFLEVRKWDVFIRTLVTQPAQASLETHLSPELVSELRMAMSQAQIDDLEHKWEMSFEGVMSPFPEVFYPPNHEVYLWEEEDAARPRESWELE